LWGIMIRKFKIILPLIAFLALTGAAYKYGGIKHDITVTAKSAGTTTLTNASFQVQSLTGTSAHTVDLPSGLTLSNGYWYKVNNEGTTGSIVVRDASGSTMATLTASQSSTFYMKDANFIGGNWSVMGGGGGTAAAAASGGGTAKFSLSGAVVPFTAIDGAHYQASVLSLTTVNISALNTGTSGTTVIQVNQYRSGALQGSATASLAASSGNPGGSAAALSGTLSLVAGDIITVDVNSVAPGASDLSVEF